MDMQTRHCELNGWMHRHPRELFQEPSIYSTARNVTVDDHTTDFKFQGPSGGLGTSW